ncbi:LOW QUALITY PROTEIN: hypothetical protein PanWU01x14_183320 [Parasponia andersonii]|uniref:Transmembrane protein n=1 Tax=Parasponia andersonii TaxID=3476 RepID=A0A2P5C4Y1_PARAD|nr:LOW QUALITY PROTEIN: hypothetical protein PanWU01x14_183320 [Parasponia andersonii]
MRERICWVLSFSLSLFFFFFFFWEILNGIRKIREGKREKGLVVSILSGRYVTETDENINMKMVYRGSGAAGFGLAGFSCGSGNTAHGFGSQLCVQKEKQTHRFLLKLGSFSMCYIYTHTHSNLYTSWTLAMPKTNIIPFLFFFFFFFLNVYFRTLLYSFYF